MSNQTFKGKQIKGEVQLFIILLVKFSSNQEILVKCIIENSADCPPLTIGLHLSVTSQQTCCKLKIPSIEMDLIHFPCRTSSFSPAYLQCAHFPPMETEVNISQVTWSIPRAPCWEFLTFLFCLICSSVLFWPHTMHGVLPICLFRVDWHWMTLLPTMQWFLSWWTYYRPRIR